MKSLSDIMRIHGRDALPDYHGWIIGRAKGAVVQGP